MKNICLLLIQFLNTLNAERIIFYLDSPVSNSKKLNGHILDLLNKNNITGESYVVRSPDHILSNSKKGIVCTSDSVIIDKQKKIFDLANEVLKFHYDPRFFSLVDNLD